MQPVPLPAKSLEWNGKGGESSARAEASAGLLFTHSRDLQQNPGARTLGLPSLSAAFHWPRGSSSSKTDGSFGERSFVSSMKSTSPTRVLQAGVSRQGPAVRWPASLQVCRRVCSGLSTEAVGGSCWRITSSSLSNPSHSEPAREERVTALQCALPEHWKMLKNGCV